VVILFKMSANHDKMFHSNEHFTKKSNLLSNSGRNVTVSSNVGDEAKDTLNSYLATASFAKKLTSHDVFRMLTQKETLFHVEIFLELPKKSFAIRISFSERKIITVKDRNVRQRKQLKASFGRFSHWKQPGLAQFLLRSFDCCKW